jgi:hypothetical protein
MDRIRGSDDEDRSSRLQFCHAGKMKKIALSEVAYVTVMAVACAISYLMTSRLLDPLVDRGDSLLGGMWGAIADVFVFRATREDSVAAGMSQLIATSVSFVIVSIYVARFPVTRSV